MIRNVSHLNIEVLNVKDTYSMSDTLWMTTEFSSRIKLDNNGGTMDIDDYICFVHQSIMKVETNGEVVTGARALDYANVNGEIYYDTRVVGDPGLWTYQSYITFHCVDGTCGFTIGYIPKAPGIYAVETIWGGFYQDTDTINCAISNEFRDNIVFPAKANIDVLTSLGIDYISLPSSSGPNSSVNVETAPNLIVMEVR